MVSMNAFKTQLLPTHKNNKAMYDKTLSDLGCETMYCCRFLQMSY